MGMNDRRSGASRRTGRKRVRWLRLFWLVAFLVALSVGVFKIYQAISYSLFTLEYETKATLPNGVKELPGSGQLNLLVLGLDGVEEDLEHRRRRSDTMFLASFDREKKNVAVLSIPRDTLVQIPQRPALEKANHAYAYGEAVLARQTVANFLRVPVHFHIVLDSAGFARLLDALGGVNIYVENDLNYEDSYQNLYIHIKRGYQHMDGETAIKYVRFRSDELGDVGRVLRQQKFIQALADKLFSVGGLFKWPDIYSLWPKALETDVNWPGFLAMLRSFKRYNRESVRFEMLPGEFTTINGVSYWETDRGEVQILLGQLGIGYIK